MDELTQEQIDFIVEILNQLSFKAGASLQILMVEEILTKLKKKEIKNVM